MDGIRVRDYAPDDLDSCLAVFDSNVPAWFTVPERDPYAAFLRELPGPYLILEDAARAVVGCGGYALRDGSTTADLCWGMVLEPLHGRGLGRLLTELRVRRAIADPRVRAVRLDTSQHTVGFYEQLGFRVTEIRENGYAPGLHRCEMRMDVSRDEGVS